MPTHLNAKLYKTVVHPVALYGAECWPATNRHEQALHVKEIRGLHGLKTEARTRPVPEIVWPNPTRPERHS